MVNPTLISAAGLVHRYRSPARRDRSVRTAVDSVNLDIRAGDRVALVGANGSGKSTLLRLLAGIEVPGEGTIEHFDRSGERLDRAQAASRTGVVFQTPGLDRLLTVEENLRLQGALHGVKDSGLRTRACAELAGITDRLGDRVGTLSGGLARRTDLARALVSQPQILMLDEPFVGLDAQSRDRFMQTLSTLIERDPAFTLVIATHATDEIRLADRVLVLDRGRIIAGGEPSALAERVFDSSELLVLASGDDGKDRPSELRCWCVGSTTIFGGDRTSAEAHAMALSRRGIPVELRAPDFATAYRVMLHEAAGGVEEAA